MKLLDLPNIKNGEIAWSSKNLNLLNWCLFFLYFAIHFYDGFLIENSFSLFFHCFLHNPWGLIFIFIKSMT